MKDALIIVVLSLGLLVSLAPTSKGASLTILTDQETGCQYLSRFWSQPIARVDANGYHMGCKGLKEEEIISYGAEEEEGY